MNTRGEIKEASDIAESLKELITVQKEQSEFLLEGILLFAKTAQFLAGGQQDDRNSGIQLEHEARRLINYIQHRTCNKQ